MDERVPPVRDVRLEDRDLQVSLEFANGENMSFTVVRDRDMRWSGSLGTGEPLVSLKAEWFDNPPVSVEGRQS